MIDRQACCRVACYENLCSPVDGVHLDAEQQHALGLAVADKVQNIFA
ncbi:hypothetical protein [Thiocapsa bogorovii]|nr:hypothetical protein [Thiocapsa bogorovii]UHD16535.1 hypothetical protein LT988_00265 [Thiocapsa bogorovii]